LTALIVNIRLYFLARTHGVPFRFTALLAQLFTNMASSFRIRVIVVEEEVVAHVHAAVS
jgi:hypothetical protein